MMLVLSRRQGEGIVTDGACVVTVAQIQGNRVKVTIEAERGVKVLRKELCDDEADREGEAVKVRSDAMHEQISGWSAAFTRDGVMYMLTVQAPSAADAARKMEPLTKVKPDARGVVRTFTTNRSFGDGIELCLDEFKAMEGKGI